MEEEPLVPSTSGAKRLRKSQSTTKEFVCPNPGCGLTYSHEKSMKTHFKDKHSGLTFICDQCNLKFSSTNSLTGHKRMVHSSMEKTIECELCGEVLKLGSLKGHMDSKHNTSGGGSLIKFVQGICQQFQFGDKDYDTAVQIDIINWTLDHLISIFGVNGLKLKRETLAEYIERGGKAEIFDKYPCDPSWIVENSNGSGHIYLAYHLAILQTTGKMTPPHRFRHISPRIQKGTRKKLETACILAIALNTDNQICLGTKDNRFETDFVLLNKRVEIKEFSKKFLNSTRFITTKLFRKRLMISHTGAYTAHVVTTNFTDAMRFE